MKLSSLHEKRPNAYLSLSFFLPAFLMMIVFATWGCLPFLNGSVLVLDLNAQYVYYFEAFRDWIYGEGSLVYSFSRSMGGEFTGMFAYYLASPLSYIVALFPKSMITEAIYSILVIKCGLSGLFAGIYLNARFRKKTGCTAVLMFSVFYALSGFVMTLQSNTMWFDAYALLPLILLGLERLIDKEGYKLYLFTFLIAVFANYYIGYMLCILVLLYSVYYWFARERKLSALPFAALRVVACSGIALLCASALLFPAYYSLTFGKTEFTEAIYTFTSQYDLLDVFAKFFFGAYDTLRPEGLPASYIGMLTILLIPFYFACRRIPLRQRIGHGVLLFAFLSFFSIQMLDLVWHGFKEPIWMNCRYAFMLSFLLIVMACEVYAHIGRARALYLPTVAILYGIVLFFAAYFKHFWRYSWITLVFSPFFLGIYCFLLLFSRKFKHKRRLFARLLLLTVTIETLLSGLYMSLCLDKDVVIVSRSSYTEVQEYWQDAVDSVKAKDNGFYRMEKTGGKKTNEPFSLGYYGLSGSTSTLNLDTLAFLNHLGILSRSHYSMYPAGSSAVADSILNVKYLLTQKGNQVSSLYTYVETVGEVDIYENPYVFGIGCTVSADIKDFHLTLPENAADKIEGAVYADYGSAFLKMNALVGAMRGEPTELFVKVNGRLKTSNLSRSGYVGGGNKYYAKPDETGTLTIPYIADGGELYFFAPSCYFKTVTLAHNGSSMGEYFTDKTSGTKLLGSPAGGTTGELVVTIGNEGGFFDKTEGYIYSLQTELFCDAFTELQEGSLHITEFSPTYMEGTVTAKDGKNTLMTTIAYDKGWQVTVDGEPVKTYEVVDALLAFDVPDGEHTVTLRYLPREYKIGRVTGAIGLVLLTATLAAEFVIRKYRKKEEE